MPGRMEGWRIGKQAPAPAHKHSEAATHPTRRVDHSAAHPVSDDAITRLHRPVTAG
ncbi:hypothetical protein MM1S1520914_0672 [Mycobacteroides abscessus subsp. bolletii 1S-152-0914]|nr:hypothetical protein MM1S1520914_0672 [Mycobacteroides abscessus subsp. bolletii 1S-152-0914]